MIINKNSWHYRLVRTASDFVNPDYKNSLPESICGYFWWASLSCTFAVVFLLFLLVSLPIWLPIVGVVMIIIVIFSYLHRAKPGTFRAVVGEYFKSFKDKICPLITYYE